MVSIELTEINNWINPIDLQNVKENEKIEITIPNVDQKIVGKIKTIDNNLRLPKVIIEFKKGELTLETTNFYTTEKLGLISYLDYKTNNVDEYHIILNSNNDPLRKWWDYIDLFPTNRKALQKYKQNFKNK